MKRNKFFRVGVVIFICLIILTILIFKIIESAGGKYIVEMDGKQYDLQKDKKELISMLKSEDKNKQLEAVKVLVRIPDESDFQRAGRDKRYMDAVIYLYKQTPPLPLDYKYGEDKEKDMAFSLKTSLFAIIVTSKDLRGKVILEEALTNDNERMKEMATKAKELLLQRKAEEESREEEKTPVKIPIEIENLSTVTIESLKTTLSNIMNNSPVKVKLEVLKVISQQENYLKSEEGEEKRALITQMLKDHYNEEEYAVVQDETILVLPHIGEYEEVRSFLEEILKDEKTPRFIRENVKVELLMLDDDHAWQEQQEQERKEREHAKSDTFLSDTQ